MTDAAPAASEPTSEPTSLVDEAVFRPVRTGNAFEDTVGRLMQTIRLGVVAPGGALPSERDLAQRFSVSRDTVREAIRERDAVKTRAVLVTLFDEVFPAIIDRADEAGLTRIDGE